MCVLYIDENLTWHSTRHSEDGEDAGIWMVKGYRIHRAELAQVILVRHIVAMPGNDVEGREGLGSTEQLAFKLQARAM